MVLASQPAGAQQRAPMTPALRRRLGYQTDTAFSRAFRREFGKPPAAWRRARAASREGA